MVGMGSCYNIRVSLRPSLRGLIVEVKDEETGETQRLVVDYININVPCGIKQKGVATALIEFDDLTPYRVEEYSGKQYLIIG